MFWNELGKTLMYFSKSIGASDPSTEEILALDKAIRSMVKTLSTLDFSLFLRLPVVGEGVWFAGRALAGSLNGMLLSQVWFINLASGLFFLLGATIGRLD
ncbi:hypothetical protein V6N12_010545 [Hibiscus sabdariffa]|uniref:Uncharacterized protein n=1 Tax=Hibiscus sabdariffa TaxID=183260 RepID=A0ABR2EKE8_9ROSI